MEAGDGVVFDGARLPHYRKLTEGSFGKITWGGSRVLKFKLKHLGY